MDEDSSPLKQPHAGAARCLYHQGGYEA